MIKQIQILNRYLRGWGNYFLIANAYQLSVDLDHWIRRRIRMCYWRQWRKPRTKVQSFIKLGVPVKMAIDCGITSKGPWRSSRTYGINMGLNDKYLRAQGLLCLRYMDFTSIRCQLVNRPVRTRMQGGVGGWRLNTSGYPISSLFKMLINYIFQNL